MFFIFGWNHQKVEEYGPVQQESCTNCHNTDIWQLKKVNRYFTLFFVPVFPHDSDSFYHCPVCNYGLQLGREDFESYKFIAQTNVDCLEKKISEEERLARLKEINAAIQERNRIDEVKNTEESKKWETMISEKSTEELQTILDKKSGEYNPAFIIAAKAELAKRK